MVCRDHKVEASQSFHGENLTLSNGVSSGSDCAGAAIGRSALGWQHGSAAFGLRERGIDGGVRALLLRSEISNVAAA
jgi:hypothetical protein